MRISILFIALGLTGCGGGLTPEQQTEYDRLGAKKETLETQSAGLEKSSKAVFQRLGSLEKKHRSRTKRVLACGFDLKGDRLVLPLKHKPGYAAYFVSATSSSKHRAACITYGLKVRKKK